MSSSDQAEDLFASIVRLDVLEAAWNKVCSNQGGAGGDGMTVEEFSIDLPTRLVRLQLGLMNGTYRPGRLRRIDVARDDGGTRPLAIPPVVDRVAQTAVAMVLTPQLDLLMHDDSFAYRPGRSVAMAVARVAEYRRQGYHWVVDGDIERYFERVPHERMMACLEPLVPEQPLRDLIELWLESWSDMGLGLPQGAPLSPLLANLYLDSIDDRISARGVRLVRFADDFLLMCRGETAAAGARDRMAALLAEQGLRLHPEKTRIVPFEQGFRFLGHLFVRSLVVRPVGEDEGADLAPDEALVLARHPASDPRQATEGEEQDPEGRAPGLRVLYVTRRGRSLVRRNQSFSVREDGAELLAIPPRRVDRIELGPGCEADDDVLRHALAHGVDVAWVDGWGETRGTLERPSGPRAGLHLAQAQLAVNSDARLDMARRIVDGRMRNQRALLRRLNRKRADAAVTDAALALNRLIRKLPLSEDVPALMGLEGAAAAAYWPALGRCLEHGWEFDRRRRRPPPDPVNLVLSYLSAVLHRDLAAFVVRHGLHPGFGALHSPRDGAQACVSDLIEEFRAPLVEGLAVYLFNNRILTRADFLTQPDDADGTRLCRIQTGGRDRLIREYEGWLDRVVKGPTGQRMLWRRVMQAQAVAYARHALGEAPYRPFIMDY